LKGSIDEPFVTAETLTATQIQQMYVSGREALDSQYRSKLSSTEIDKVNEIAADTNIVTAIDAPRMLKTGITRAEGIFIGTNGTSEDDGALSFLTTIGDTRTSTFNENYSDPYLISDNDIVAISTSSDGAYIIVATADNGITIIQSGSTETQLKGNKHVQSSQLRPHN
jgi:hypothetical protein